MQKQATQWLGLLAAILITWFVIPLISINHIPLLPKTVDKLIAVSILLMFWIAYLFYQLSLPNISNEKSSLNDSKLYSLIENLFGKIKAFKKDPTLDLNEGPYTDANLILEKHFQLVQEHFRLHSKKKKYPVYMILGNKFSGKSTLLKKSGLSLKSIPIHQIQEQQENYYKSDYDDNTAEETSYCLWNLHENCIFIDTPGDYANSEVSDNLQTPWRSLINLLLRKYQKFPIKALILTISIHELLSSGQQNTRITLHLLRQRLLDVKKYYGEALPLHLIFTKWDCIPGFSEFFDNLTITERQQTFAIKFDKNFSEQTIVSQFQQQYELLLQQLSRLLIMRMHQEHNPKKRALISQFPLQMEQLQKAFNTIVKQILEKSYETDTAKPASIYFTSGEQGEETVDNLYQNFQTNFNLPQKQLVITKPKLIKDYFIQNVFQEFSNCDKPTQTELMVSRKIEYLIYASTAVVAVSFAGFFFAKLTDSLKTINNAEASTYALSLLKHSEQNPSATENATQTLANQVDHASHFWLAKQIALTNTKIKTDAPINIIEPPINTSQLAITSMPLTLQNFLEHRLANSSNTPPPVLYSTLKAYLMLANPEHLQDAWLSHWLTSNAVKHHIINATTTKQILLALQQKHPLFKPQTTLVNQVRNSLTGLPKEYLAFIMLQSEADYASSTGLSITVANKKIIVPILFTAKGLQTLFLNTFNGAISNAINGNWVLGQLTADKTSSPNIQQEVIGMYTTNYVSWWNKVFFEIHVPTFTNLQSLNNYVTLLSDPNVGIIHAYNVILQNTNADLIFPTSVNTPLITNIRNSLAAQVSSGLTDLIHLNLSPVQTALTQYSQFLNNLMSTNNRGQTAFLIIKNQIINPSQTNILLGFADFANTLPEPLNSSFTSLANQSVQLTQQAAINYLQTAWDSQVMQFYNQYLAGRYPLDANSQQDADLNAFTQFFGPNGILDQFYANNLAMFIDTSSSVWQWQATNGVSLPFNNQVLIALEKARIITSMFFSQNSSTPRVDFTLQQIALMPIVQSFSINMNGQILNDQKGTRNISSFIWPGNGDNLGTQLSFLDINGQHAVTQADGPWSWFRVLNASQLHAKDDSQHYTVTFDVDGNEARYLLTAENSINPFIPGIIDTFQLPERIVS